MKHLIVAILLAYASAASAQPNPSTGQDALAAIDACIPKLDAELDVGYERVAAHCPHLAHTLERSGWAQWLPRGWKEARNDLSAGSLMELRMLVARELETPSGTRALNVKRLNEVLAGLGPAVREQSSLWSRFRAWLRAVVRQNKPTGSRGWLDHMLQSDGRSQTIIDLTTYSALGLLIALAGVIVANEMRTAGLLRSRQRTPAAAGLAHDSSRTGRASWRDVEQAALAEKPGLLLELVIARLTDLQRAPPAGALTVRELMRRVELTDAADRRRLSDIAVTAERARYSPAPPTCAAIDSAIGQARELLARLQGPVA